MYSDEAKKLKIMKPETAAGSPIPGNINEAERKIQTASSPEHLSRQKLHAVWMAAAFLYPSMHTDNGENEIPENVRPIWREVWERYESGTFSDDELYPVAATRSRILHDMQSSNPGDYSPGDRFFGPASRFEETAEDKKGIGPCLLINTDGIVHSVHDSPAEALLERDREGNAGLKLFL